MNPIKNIILVILGLFVTLNVNAQNKEIRTTHYNLKKTLAIQGYDPVSYFKNDPKEGDEDISCEYNGATYYFSNKANLESFKKTPAKYEPQYGGWCAYAIGATAEKVKIDPETYKIANDKLYLFYNFWGTNTLESWDEDEKSLKNKADSNWSDIIN